MRRLTLVAIPVCALLGLAIGVMLSNTGSKSSTSSANRAASTTTTTAKVAGIQCVAGVVAPNCVTTTTLPSVPTTTATTAPAPTTTTTTKPAAARRVTPTTRPSTTTTKAPAKPASDCGSGTASADASSLTVDNTDGTYNVRGPVRVVNNVTKAIVVDTLVVHITFTDGTTDDAAVSGGAGTNVASGATRTFDFSHSSQKSPQSVSMTFTFHIDGHPECAAQ